MNVSSSPHAPTPAKYPNTESRSDRAGRARPRRPRVQHLENEHRRPGQPHHPTADHCRERPWRPRRGSRAAGCRPALPSGAPPTPATSSPGPADGDQVEVPVVGVHQCCGHGRHGDQPPPAGQLQRPADRQVPQDGLQGHERVHAGVGAVIDRPRRAGPEQERCPRRPSAPGTLAGRPQEREGGRGDDARKRPHREIALPEQRASSSGGQGSKAVATRPGPAPPAVGQGAAWRC